MKKTSRQLSLLLVLVLLTSSSQALEILVHDLHGHGEYQFVVPDPHDVSSGPHAISGHGSDSADSGVEPAAGGHNDCLCSEICCLSTVVFSLTGGSYPHPVVESFTSRLSGKYQSVLLDLLLPPPNR